MADLHEAPPARGDEADLFRCFDRKLVRYVSGVVKVTASDTLEDACAHAWMQFMQRQPEREENWRAWLCVVAEREAWAFPSFFTVNSLVDNTTVSSLGWERETAVIRVWNARGGADVTG